MWNVLMLAVTLLSVQKNGVDLTVTAESATVDPATDVSVRMTVKAAPGVTVKSADLGRRVQGFAVEPDVNDEPEAGADGSVTATYGWRLTPEPCADVYRIAPFAVVAEAAGKDASFRAGPVYFERPAARAVAPGGMEVPAPRERTAGIPWKLVGWCALGLCGLALVLAGLGYAARVLLRMLREHRMSPIERAWVELDRLLKRGLPGRGRYKDFYVELTMVVRRYVQRKYGIRAPHLTTEEFFAEIARTGRMSAEQGAHLRAFLSSADMVKFAGVQASPEMADEATVSARTYLKRDAAVPAAQEGGKA